MDSKKQMMRVANAYWSAFGVADVMQLQTRQHQLQHEAEQSHHAVEGNASATNLDKLEMLLAREANDNIQAARNLVLYTKTSFNIFYDPLSIRMGDTLHADHNSPQWIAAVNQLVDREQAGPGKDLKRVLERVFNPTGQSKFAPIARARAEHATEIFFDSIAVSLLVHKQIAEKLSEDEQTVEQNKAFMKSFGALLEALPKAFVTKLVDPQIERLANLQGYEVRPMTHAVETTELLGRIAEESKGPIR